MFAELVLIVRRRRRGFLLDMRRCLVTLAPLAFLSRAGRIKIPVKRQSTHSLFLTYTGEQLVALSSQRRESLVALAAISTERTFGSSWISSEGTFGSYGISAKGTFGSSGISTKGIFGSSGISARDLW